MFEMFSNSVSLFLQGRLFKDLGSVLQKLLIGIVIGAVILVVAVKAGLPLWLAIVVGSLACGATQPFLFKNLKYA